jgi:hypothetical protein
MQSVHSGCAQIGFMREESMLDRRVGVNNRLITYRVHLQGGVSLAMARGMVS